MKKKGYTNHCFKLFFFLNNTFQILNYLLNLNLEFQIMMRKCDKTYITDKHHYSTNTYRLIQQTKTTTVIATNTTPPSDPPIILPTID